MHRLVCRTQRGWGHQALSHPFPLGGTSHTSRLQAHLQHRWKTLSGLPSDSDFTWTISHTAFASASREIKTRTNESMFQRDLFAFLQKHFPCFGVGLKRTEPHMTKETSFLSRDLKRQNDWELNGREEKECLENYQLLKSPSGWSKRTISQSYWWKNWPF